MLDEYKKLAKYFSEYLKNNLNSENSKKHKRQSRRFFGIRLQAKKTKTMSDKQSELTKQVASCKKLV